MSTKLEKREEQVLPGSKEGEMDPTMYAHRNK
jgi:hypothetical protein